MSGFRAAVGLRRGLALLLLVSGVPAAGAPAEEKIFATLADFDFDGPEPPASGPDTFAVFTSEQGTVRRVYDYRVSGEMSLEIADRAGDGHFPELQGYFTLRRSGEVYCHFAFLVVNPEEEFDVALAGPESFSLRRDGIAFWLENRGGRLVHWSDGIPRKLIDLQGFTWYFVDLRYSMERGTYDLALRQEGLSEPLVQLRAQPNVTSSAGSAVDKFSFVGDPQDDRSNVVYYVDDIRIAAGERLPEKPFVAPGRRALFLDLLAEREKAGPAGEEEAQADELLRGGNPLAARDLYVGLIAGASADAAHRLYLKLADAYWLLGDVEAERKIRETYYGALR